MHVVVISLASYGVALALSQCASYLFYSGTCRVLAEILYYLSWPLYVLGIVGVFTLGAARELDISRLSQSENVYRKWSVQNAKSLTHALYNGSRLTRLKALANVDASSKEELEQVEKELYDVRAQIDAILAPYVTESCSMVHLHYLLRQAFHKSGKDALPAEIPANDKQTLLSLYRHENFYIEPYPYDEYHEDDLYIKKIRSFVDYDSTKGLYSGAYNAEEFTARLCLPADAQLWIFRIPLFAKFLVWPLSLLAGLLLIFLIVRFIG